jgi:hypothetical protein
MVNRQAVIDYAVRRFKANTDVEVTVEDALIWSMEHYDTDDMTQAEYDALLNDVKGRL